MNHVTPTHPTAFDGVPVDRIAAKLKEAAGRIRVLEEQQREPIAVVGMACRMPGDLNSPRQLWDALLGERDMVSPVPSDRWDRDALYHPTPGAPGKIVTSEGGFLGNVDQFDPQFFGISPREADSMDPQHRLLLELAVETLEDAGARWDTLSGSATGVFVGITNNDYARVLLKSGQIDDIDAHFASGNALNAAAGRLSYILGLNGPSLAIDTACSSSLVAVHNAMRSLRLGECDTALAGGVNLILSPEASIATSRAHMLAPDGRCKTFSDAADGYVRSEGGGLVTLMRLSQAVAENRQVLAVLRGSAVNQNGTTSGFTVPSTQAQQKLLNTALDGCGIAPDTIGYVEAHGTGTSLGDPIELNALKSVFGTSSRNGKLLVGSVKSNLGHLESAAGIAGLIKAIMVVREKKIPASLHLDQLTTKFDWDTSGLKAAKTLTDWPRDVPCRAGVSSFGASGTNAHILVEAVPVTTQQDNNMPADATCVLALSARTDAGLRTTAQTAAAFLADTDEVLQDICRTVNHRKHWRDNMVVVHAKTAKAASEALIDFCNCTENKAVQTWSKQSNAQADAPKYKLLFPASQALQIATVPPQIRGVLRALAGPLGPLLNTGIRDLIDGKATPDTPTDKATAFAVAVAKYTWFKAHHGSIDTIYVAGDGLIAAAYLAGVIDEDWVIAWLSDSTLNPSTSTAQIALRCANSGADLSRIFSDPGRGAAYLAKPADITGQDSFVSVHDALLPHSMATAYLAGRPVAWAAVYPIERRAGTDFPKSRFETRRCWPENRQTTKSVQLEVQDGSLIDSHADIHGLNAFIAESVIAPAKRPEYAHHLVFGKNVIAGACHVSLMIEALRLRTGNAAMQITDLQFQQALVVTENAARKFQITLSENEKGAIAAQSISTAVQTNTDPITHAVATLSQQSDTTTNEVSGDALNALLKDCKDIAADAFYETLFDLSQIKHGAAYRWVQMLRMADGSASAALHAPAQTPCSGLLPPGLVDTCFQLVAAAYGIGEPTTFVPFGCARVTLSGLDAHGPLTAHATIDPAKSGRSRIVGAVTLRRDTGAHVATFEGVEFRRATEALLLRAFGTHQQAQQFAVAWAPAEDAESSASQTPITIVCDDAKDTNAAGLCTAISDLGHTCEIAVQAQSDAAHIVYIAPQGQSPDDTQPLRQTHDFVQSVLGLETLPQTLTIVTSGATQPQSSTPFTACIWGYGRVLANEHPNIAVHLVDLDQCATSLPTAAHEICSTPARTQIAIYDGQTHEPQLQLANDTTETLRVASDRTYLITGGFGGLGRKIGQELLTAGARHLILAGRNVHSPACNDFVQSLQSDGAQITAVTLDLEDAQSVTAQLDAGLADMPALAGVIHTAGVLNDGLLSTATWNDIQGVLSAKLHGAWTLHDYTAGMDLDVFALFSSASALFGTPGQAAYAAANSGLDALADYRRAQGMAATSLVWGPWDEVGMAARSTDAATSAMSRFGIEPILPDDGAKAFMQASAPDRPAQTAVFSSDANRVVAAGPQTANRVFFRDLAALADPDAAAAAAQAPGLLAELHSLPQGEAQLLFTRDWMVAAVSDGSGISTDEIDTNVTLSALGIDSIMIMELATSVQSSFGVQLPMSLVADGSSIESLSAYVLEHCPKDMPVAIDSANPVDEIDLDDAVQVGELLAILDGLSPEDVQALLEAHQ